MPARILLAILDALAVPLSLPARIAGRLRTARTRSERLALTAAGWFVVAVAVGVICLFALNVLEIVKEQPR